jgi:hypothetical protein
MDDYDLKSLDPTLAKPRSPGQAGEDETINGYDMRSLDPTIKKVPVDNVENIPLSWGDAALQAIKNVPDSAVSYGKNLISPIVHPVDTIKALGNTAIGTAQAIAGSELGMDDKTRFAQAIADYYKNRYGGVENFKRSLAEDPVGIAGDVAAVLSMGGGALSKAGKLANIPTAAKVGGLMSGASTWVDPASLAFRPFAATRLPEKLYGAALKPSTTLTPGERSAVISAGLKEKIPVSYGGALKNANIRRSLADKLDDALRGSNTPQIDPAVAAERLRDTVQDALRSYNPSRDVGKVADVYESFLTDPLVPNLLTPSQANAMKQGLYREIESAYGNMKAPLASQAKKALARGLKEEVNIAVPEVAPINDRLSTLIQLAEQLDPAANRVANRNPIGLTATTAAAAGAPAGRPLSSGALGAIFSSPWWGSRGAMLLDNIRGGVVGPQIGGYGIDPLARGLLYESGNIYDQNR